MKKIILQGLAIAAVFFAVLFGMMQVDWLNLLHLNRISADAEQKLGDNIWDAISSSETEVKEKAVTDPVDSIITKICVANGIDRKEIKPHVVESADVNAFSIPNGHIIIYTGLITACENQDELTGVICHEMAHVKLNHVMKKLLKEVGLSVLLSMTTGKTGGDIIRKTGKTLSSTAYDRKLEREADIQAVDYMIAAKCNPGAFADFLYRLSLEGDQSPRYLDWVSTHPDSKERSEYIIDYCKDKKNASTSTMIADSTWNEMVGWVNRK